eukprot:755848-Hanusia_phi.AAC.2
MSGMGTAAMDGALHTPASEEHEHREAGRMSRKEGRRGRRGNYEQKHGKHTSSSHLRGTT